MAARFWIGGGTNTNWNASPTTNWSATSGGAVRVAAPTSSDDVTFDGAGNSASVLSSTLTVLSLTFTSGFTSSLTINTAVNLGIAGNFSDNTAHTWVVNGTGSMVISASSTIASGGKTFPGPVTFNGAAATKTLNGDWTITGALIIATNAQIINRTAAEVLNAAGLTISVGSSGTATINLTGGTWSGGGAVQNNLTFAGNVTVSGSVVYNAGTLTYSSGTITTTGSTLSVNATSTLNTNGINWNNVTFSGATITLNSLLTVLGTLTAPTATLTFAGSAGFICATFTTSNTSTNTITLVNGVTYTITTALTCFTSRNGSILVFTSDHATNKAILTLQNGATCNVLASFTRIDASNGRAILTFNGTITNCINVFSYNDVQVPPRKYSRGLGRRQQIYNRAKAVTYQ